MKDSNLTPKEREMLARAAELVLAGEWPWEGPQQSREIAVLQRAADKLSMIRPTSTRTAQEDK